MVQRTSTAPPLPWPPSQPRFLKVHDSILPLASAIILLLSPRSRTSGSEEIRKIITFRFRLFYLPRGNTADNPLPSFFQYECCAHTDNSQSSTPFHSCCLYYYYYYYWLFKSLMNI